jgi:hypothetical protein
MKVLIDDQRVQWKNRKSSKDFGLKTNLYLQNWCNALLKKANYRRFESNMVKNLYYVIPISDSKIINTMSQIKSDIEHQEKDYEYDIHIIFVILGLNNEKIKLGPKQHVISFSGPFSRAIGLKIGTQFVLKHESDIDNVIIMSMDAGMSIGATFSNIVMKNTVCDRSSFLPISKDINSGRWIESGYGMLAICLKDYVKLEFGWNEKLGYNWGAEDLDMIYQIQETELQLIRFRINNFTHKSMHQKTNYYAKKNFLGKFLPVVPNSQLMNNKIMQQDILEFIEQRSGHKINNYIMRSKLSEKNQMVTIREFVEGKNILHQISIPIPIISQFEQDKWRLKKPSS